MICRMEVRAGIESILFTLRVRSIRKLTSVVDWYRQKTRKRPQTGVHSRMVGNPEVILAPLGGGSLGRVVALPDTWFSDDSACTVSAFITEL
jgi:hypothetical protein